MTKKIKVVNPEKSEVVFLMPNGLLMSLDDYQAAYGLTGKQIAKHFSYSERIFARDLKDYKKLVVCHLLMQILDEYRSLKGSAVNLNSFNRDPDKQERLLKDGVRAAKFSPHVVKMAADVDTDTEEETLLAVRLLQEASRKLGILIRLGYKQYIADGKTFVHVDVCPEYYGKGKVWYSEPHPVQWTRSMIW